MVQTKEGAWRAQDCCFYKWSLLQTDCYHGMVNPLYVTNSRDGFVVGL